MTISLLRVIKLKQKLYLKGFPQGHYPSFFLGVGVIVGVVVVVKHAQSSPGYNS